ncbi:hypothetical protein EDB85DRAFT_1900269 [Lactarius pseudohatsudake]|nr:hypothetical protein EDB85DRAFT_1900269 [Lactarius pseudohatsudake]
MLSVPAGVVLRQVAAAVVVAVVVGVASQIPRSWSSPPSRCRGRGHLVVVTTFRRRRPLPPARYHGGVAVASPRVEGTCALLRSCGNGVCGAVGLYSVLVASQRGDIVTGLACRDVWW